MGSHTPSSEDLVMSICRAWMLLCKARITAEDSSHVAVQRAATFQCKPALLFLPVLMCCDSVQAKAGIPVIILLPLWFFNSIRHPPPLPPSPGPRPAPSSCALPLCYTPPPPPPQPSSGTKLTSTVTHFTCDLMTRIFTPNMTITDDLVSLINYQQSTNRLPSRQHQT